VSSFPLFPKRSSELIVFGKEKNGKKKWLCDSPWIEKPLENWLIFAKTGETGLDWFRRFLVNRSDKFENSKN
jgi:hypothetical protein